jgi:hypothetical protein
MGAVPVIFQPARAAEFVQEVDGVIPRHVAPLAEALVGLRQKGSGRRLPEGRKECLPWRRGM